MTIDPTTLLTILGMALFTYLTRIGGLVLVSRLAPSPRAKAALDAVPPAVLMAVIAPVALTKGPAETAAIVITALAALRLPLLACVASGVASVLVLRAVLG